MTPIELVLVRITNCLVRLLSQAVFFSLVSPVFCIAAQIPGPQRVLVLYSDERLLPANVIFDHSFRTNLQLVSAGASSFTASSSTWLAFRVRRSSNASGIF